MSDYRRLIIKLEELNDEKKIHDKLHEYGVSYKLTQYFIDCEFAKLASSGYSMGETIDICYKGNIIVRYDCTKEYSKSCKWKANHGHIVFNFKTKKDLINYCKICKEHVIAKKNLKIFGGMSHLYDINTKLCDILKKAYDKNSSVIHIHKKSPL